jgi:hypothetical protein
MTLVTYGQVIDELEGAEPRPAEEVIHAARDEFVRTTFSRSAKNVGDRGGKIPAKAEKPSDGLEPFTPSL